MSITQILDDRDPPVVYSSGWLRAGSSNEFNATTTYANDAGLTATLVFEGIRVFVYGTLGPRNAQRVSPQSSYSVDGSAPVIYQAVQSTGVQYNTRFYSSALLPNGQHTLFVTNLIASDSFFLDYFLISRPDNGTSLSQLVPTSTGKSPSQTPAATANTVEGQPSSSSNTGTIVGSAIGAAALVILAVALMLWLRGRNKRTQNDPGIVSFREDPSIDANPPVRQTIQPPIQSGSYQTSSGSATFSPSQQPHDPNLPYDPYDPSSLAPPPGYVPNVSQQSGPRQNLPSKFAQEYRSSTSTRS